MDDHTLFEIMFVAALILVIVLLLTSAMAYDGFKKASARVLDADSAAARRQMAYVALGFAVAGLGVVLVAFYAHRGVHKRGAKR